LSLYYGRQKKCRHETDYYKFFPTQDREKKLNRFEKQVQTLSENINSCCLHPSLPFLHRPTKILFSRGIRDIFFVNIRGKKIRTQLPGGLVFGHMTDCMKVAELQFYNFHVRIAFIAMANKSVVKKMVKTGQPLTFKDIFHVNLRVQRHKY
jgi:hypothetical protein